MDTQQQIKAIKLRFRQSMNGIVSQSMRNHGADYKVNFGLTLPLLRRIAQEMQPDAQLANALWNDTSVRESMMLAPMLYPVEEFDESVADRWIASMPNTEVADICCKYLFCKSPFASKNAYDWSLSGKPLCQYTGFQLASALLQNRFSLDKSWWIEMVDTAIELINRDNQALSFAIMTFLKHSLIDDTVAAHLLTAIEQRAADEKYYQRLLEELNSERDLLLSFRV